MGIQLLERGYKEFIFTPAGLEVLERARGIMRRMEEVDALSKVWNDPYSGELPVGAFPTLAIIFRRSWITLSMPIPVCGSTWLKKRQWFWRSG